MPPNPYIPAHRKLNNRVSTGYTNQTRLGIHILAQQRGISDNALVREIVEAYIQEHLKKEEMPNDYTEE